MYILWGQSLKRYNFQMNIDMIVLLSLKIIFVLVNNVDPNELLHQGAFDMIVLLSLKIIFVLAKNVDPNELLHQGAFYLDLHCLLKKALNKGLIVDISTWVKVLNQESRSFSGRTVHVTILKIL